MSTRKLYVGLKMKNEIRCEIPNSDAHRIFNSMDEIHLFLSSHGVIMFNKIKDHAGRLLIEVPDFAESRERYSKAKADNCAKWGCE